MEEKIKHINTQSRGLGACRIALASVVGKPKDECKGLKVLYAKTDLDKKKCSLERAMPSGWAIGCVLICVFAMVGMKIQADTMKDLEGQIKALHQKEFDDLFYQYEIEKLDFDTLKRTLKDTKKMVSFANRMFSNPPIDGHLDIVMSLCGQLQDFSCSQLKADMHAAFIIRYPEIYGEMLIKAAAKGSLDIFQFLIPLLEDKNPADNHGMTPLHVAASNGKAEVVKYLVPLLSDKNPKTNCGDTPLHSAAGEGHLDIVKYLCGQIQDRNPKGCRHGGTPFFVAFMSHKWEVIKYLATMVDDPRDLTKAVEIVGEQRDLEGIFWPRGVKMPEDTLLFEAIKKCKAANLCYNYKGCGSL